VAVGKRRKKKVRCGRCKTVSLSSAGRGLADSGSLRGKEGAGPRVQHALTKKGEENAAAETASVPELPRPHRGGARQASWEEGGKVRRGRKGKKHTGAMSKAPASKQKKNAQVTNASTHPASYR